MNNIEDMFPSFSNQVRIHPVVSDDVLPFMNSHEDNALQQMENKEFFQFIENQFVERAFISIGFDKRFARYPQSDIEKMCNQVRRYIHLMGASFIPNKTHFRIDDMSIRSVEVRFSQREDMSLNLFIKEMSDDEPDYDETYISYIEDGRSILVNDTMESMVCLVKKLLGL